VPVQRRIVQERHKQKYSFCVIGDDDLVELGTHANATAVPNECPHERAADSDIGTSKQSFYVSPIMEESSEMDPDKTVVKWDTHGEHLIESNGFLQAIMPRLPNKY